MRYILFLFIINSTISFSQDKDFFMIARKGTVDEAKVAFQKNTACINEANKDGFSPLILACYSGNNEVIDFLIANNANVNYTSQEGTALMAATVKGNLDLVALLLKKGADPDLKNKTGITALMYAVQFKNVDIVKLLLNSGANKSLQDNEGRTAFEYAVFTKNDEIINLLK